ncbi:4-diphosphocytidyl-2-C-methyl-D-erythritol kinase [Frondihabitans sp. PhB188]|uniref:4-(cytidine 5'-diphospho)-2-C-methyl-D-erythritol kinase n=1 Tax=Frondihabitans sp. PhB188 TaxID=2485200 RepID=UPI000F46625F|nr:4-(cytidine 5'-diphospho)-2-C-methyl-D-erythritol kinase [Frondihabitans sp. PhB188]ROQ38583.1 4-diphosphocytidyl-2-C-methyl-D-erythritol kinase [Frondihabitans sp. PhB188]
MTSVGSPTVVHTRAPGKINVYLRVGDLQDDGYHELATAYQAVSLYEDVRAAEADAFTVRFTSVHAGIDLSGVPVDDTNLAIRAAKLLAKATGHRGGVELVIDKNVPVAGGMGGGSADAAATLLACDTLWGTGLSRDELLRLGAQLGADVPFALMGGTAIGTGRGDELSPALAQGSFQWVLALADFGLSTPAVYRELDEHRNRHRADISPVVRTPRVESGVLQALRAGDPALLADVLHNDLQAPALHLEPGLADVLELGEQNGALAGVVSGSGPTVAFLAPDLDGALELQIALSASGLDVVRATGPVHGARVVAD